VRGTKGESISRKPPATPRGFDREPEPSNRGDVTGEQCGANTAAGARCRTRAYAAFEICAVGEVWLCGNHQRIWRAHGLRLKLTRKWRAPERASS